MSETVIKILEPGDEQALEAFLAPRIESSMFLLSNLRAAGLADSGQPYAGTYAAAIEEGEIVGVVAHYWNGVLVFQAPVHLQRLWRAAAAASPRLISGLIGPDEQVTLAKDSLGIEEAGAQLDETERLYRLSLADLRVPHALACGEVRGRRIEEQDIDTVTAWSVAYRIEATGEADRPELWHECRASANRSLEEGRTWVLEHAGRLVASSSFNSAIEDAVQVGGVWTPPELRRRGFGRCVVAASLVDAREESARIAILFTGLRNMAAQRAYEALGFEHIGVYRLVLLRPSVAPG